MGYFLDDTELYLFNTGANAFAYRTLGAREVASDGQKALRFAVWAPHAAAVSVVGDFNQWEVGATPMQSVGTTGVWQAHIQCLEQGALYKYAITTPQGEVILKADPFAFYSQLRPDTASRVWDIQTYHWHDSKWQRQKKTFSPYESPISIYELHLGSWCAQTTYRAIADQLAPYIKQMGYTHVELMPPTEYPLDESWGYQVTGYFSATARYGTPQDLMYLVDTLHQAGIGVIIDWVPAHFPKDAHGLRRFDGLACYEHPDPRQAEQPDWGTMLFHYAKGEVVSFLMSTAMFWLDVFHIDGLRADAVSCMLYLDYSKKDGGWVPNKHGGRENLEAIEFLHKISQQVFINFPGTIFAAEESTAFALVTKPCDVGGLGFNYKWNMGWMHDLLEYMSMDSYFRKWNHNKLTFSMYYAFSENYILSLSHDEVVHGKKSLLDKMPGVLEDKFAQMRLLFCFMFAHPGKKLMFMGAELGEFIEWRWYEPLEWNLLALPLHKGLNEQVKALNFLYRAQKALHQVEDSWQGFEWIRADDNRLSVISFERNSKQAGRKPMETISVICSFTPVVRKDLRIGVSKPGNYVCLHDAHWDCFGGNIPHTPGKPKTYVTQDLPCDNKPQSISLDLPPYGAVYLKWMPYTQAQQEKLAQKQKKQALLQANKLLKQAQKLADKNAQDAQLQESLKAAIKAAEKAQKAVDKLRQ